MPQSSAGSPRSSPPRQARTIVTFGRVHGCIVEQRCYTPGCTCKTRTATCEVGEARDPGAPPQPQVPHQGTGGSPWKRVRSEGGLHLPSKRQAGPQRFPPRESSRKRGRGLRQAVKSCGLTGTHSGPALGGQRASPRPMEKEKPDGNPPHACRGRDAPCSPLGPTLSPPQQLLESSNGHHGKTGSETTWCSWGELWHHRPTGLRPVPDCLRAAPVHRHPSEPGPLTCFKPDTWERLRQAQNRRFPLPGTTPARHRAAGSRLERAQGFRTSVAPRPRSG